MKKIINTILKYCGHTKSEKVNNSAYGAEKLEMVYESEAVTAWTIKNTPFTILKEEEEQYFLTMGKYRLSEDAFETIEEALKDSERQDWMRVMEIIQLLIENNNIEKNLNK